MKICKTFCRSCGDLVFILSNETDVLCMQCLNKFKSKEKLMRSEAECVKTLGIVTGCIAMLIIVFITAILCTSCAAIDKNKAEIEQIADDIANEAIEDVIKKVEKK